MADDRHIPPTTGNSPSGKRIWNVPVWIATGSYVGLAPFMPGTWGSLWGIPLTFGLQQIPQIWVQVLILLVLWGIGVPICTAAARRLQSKDPGAVVLDEFVALPVTYLGFAVTSPAVCVVGFVLFRIFDVLKPFPVRQVERLPRGLGIMSDDLVAALYAHLCMHLLVFVGLL